MATGPLPLRGTITSWNVADLVGKITCSDGEEIRFGMTSCQGFVPALGMTVFVVSAEPHPLGGRKAKVVNQTGAAQADRESFAEEVWREEKEAKARVAAEIARLKEEKKRVLLGLEPPFRVVREAHPSLDLAAARARLSNDAITGAVEFLTPADHPDLALGSFEWADDWEWYPWADGGALDPCFVCLGGADGDLLGVYLHPPSLAKGLSPPVVYYFHEFDPVLSWVAESLGHLERMIAAAADGDEVEAHRGARHPALDELILAVSDLPKSSDDERRLVHALHWKELDASATVATLDRLERIYADSGWTLALAHVRATKIPHGILARIAELRASVPKAVVRLEGSR